MGISWDQVPLHFLLGHQPLSFSHFCELLRHPFNLGLDFGSFSMKVLQHVKTSFCYILLFCGRFGKALKGKERQIKFPHMHGNDPEVQGSSMESAKATPCSVSFKQGRVVNKFPASFHIINI